jgi:hypothetical protein
MLTFVGSSKTGLIVSAVVPPLLVMVKDPLAVVHVKSAGGVFSGLAEKFQWVSMWLAVIPAML